MARRFENLRNDKRNGNQYAYLLDAIHNPETGENYTTDAEAVRAAWAQFCKEFNHEYNRRRYPNLSQRVGEWFAGLPSGVGIAYTYADIISTGQAWGYCQTDKKAEKKATRSTARKGKAASAEKKAAATEKSEATEKKTSVRTSRQRTAPSSKSTSGGQTLSVRRQRR